MTWAALLIFIGIGMILEVLMLGVIGGFACVVLRMDASKLRNPHTPMFEKVMMCVAFVYFAIAVHLVGWGAFGAVVGAYYG